MLLDLGYLQMVLILKSPLLENHDQVAKVWKDSQVVQFSGTFNVITSGSFSFQSRLLEANLKAKADENDGLLSEVSSLKSKATTLVEELSTIKEAKGLQEEEMKKIMTAKEEVEGKLAKAEEGLKQMKSAVSSCSKHNIPMMV